MTPDLPSPIAAYVAANAQLDVDGMLKPFADDVVVKDNGAVLVGTPNCGPCSNTKSSP
ncbi:nuclear transport factor 2 family protein [Caulobacter sp.]|uniref:nuclear transport factor 2 family protein n=1 Tax=Caulobacter sp. TaxID=78 RepID=UPI0025B946F4|nr:nuclear transport factor 2 family protein [Caulobacter sp.]